MDKVKAILSKALSLEDLDNIKKYKAELAEALTPPAPGSSPLKTKDGLELFVEGDKVVGSKISIVNPETKEKTEAPDGSYQMDDGTEIIVTGGLITSINDKKEEQAPEMNPEMKSQMSAQKQSIDALETKLNNQEKQLKSVMEQNKFLLESFEKLVKAPVITEEVTPAKSWEEMTPLERRRAEKNK